MQNQTNKLKILNDPIYGFITIPNTLIFDLIEHPYFQRLRRITQMGLSCLVYPGANHTRFHHAIGCMHLMQKAVRILRFKGVSISEEEANALYIAILLHDIGHGPFSHALEQSIVSEIHHEEISLQFMKALNKEFDGKLDLAIKIFTGNYSKKFMCQLISSQLDVDRLDYLKRDSFYTGVAEGNVNSERLITMLNVKKDELVVEEKGIYSVEKFIMARRLMYWQVYLHKTSFVAEKVLAMVLLRAKELVKQGVNLPASSIFTYFLQKKVTLNNFTTATLKTFAKLDDYDVLSAIKDWINVDDKILRELCISLINRKLPKIVISSTPIPKEEIEKFKKKVSLDVNVDSSYFFYAGKITNQAYDVAKNQIKIMAKDGNLKDITQASDHFNIKALSKPVVKYFMCYPKQQQ